MPVLGSSSKPTYSYFAFDGTGNPNMVAERLTAPSKIRILSLGCWIGGWNDSFPAQMSVWALDGTNLGNTAAFTVANQGAAGDGNTANYVHPLVTPVIIESGVVFYVGTNRDRDGAAQWGTGTTVNDHYRARGGYPNGTLGSVEGPTAVARRTGMYVADYQAVASAWVRRGGVWVQASDASVFRDGAWVQVDSVSVLRGSTWTDAE